MYKKITFPGYDSSRFKLKMVESYGELLNTLLPADISDYNALSLRKRKYLNKVLDGIFKCPNVLVASVIHSETQRRAIELTEEIYELIIYNVTLNASRSIVVLSDLVIDVRKSEIFLNSMSYSDILSLASPLKREIDRLERITIIDNILKEI